MPSNSSGSFTRIGRRNCSFTSPKIAVLAPMPSASVSTATAVKPGFFSNWRNAYRRSLKIAKRVHQSFRESRSVDLVHINNAVKEARIIDAAARDTQGTREIERGREP